MSYKEIEDDIVTSIIGLFKRHQKVEIGENCCIDLVKLYNNNNKFNCQYSIVHAMYRYTVDGYKWTMSSDTDKEILESLIRVIDRISTFATFEYYHYVITTYCINKRELFLADIKDRLKDYGEVSVVTNLDDEGTSISLYSYLPYDDVALKYYMDNYKYYLNGEPKNKFNNRVKLFIDTMDYVKNSLGNYATMKYKNNKIDVYKVEGGKEEMSNEVVNINSISFTVDDNNVSVDFEGGIITINDTDYTKGEFKNILKGLKEVGVDVGLQECESPRV